MNHPEVLITVLIPTFDHTDTLIYAISSVLQQSMQNFEILVVGDGAPPRTDEIMYEMCESDGRISYIANEKGSAQGEIYRHHVLQNAQGEYVCYLSDDDLWLPNHLELMYEKLKENDFTHTLHVNVRISKTILALEGSLESKSDVQRMLDSKFNFFGLSFAGHSLTAYHRLPDGWRPRPDGMWSDLHMWRQWLEQPWVKATSIPVPSALHFPSPKRKGWTTEQRTDELKYWSGKISEPNFYSWLCQEVTNYRQK